LTGSKLINNRGFKNKLLNDFKRKGFSPIGGEMEAFGIYSMCRYNGINEWIIVKSICDWAYDKDIDKEKNQKIAAKAAIGFCHHVFKRKGIFNDLTGKKRAERKKRPESQSPKETLLKFSFKIDINGNAVSFDENTTKTIDEWYYNKATDLISEMRNESLRDTFEVVVDDLRIPNIDRLQGEINAKLKNGNELTEYESYLALGQNVLKRDNAFITSAIELFLSNRVAQTFLGINHPRQLQEMIMEILNFRYGDLMYKIPNNRELISLDVFLNLNGRNAKHEGFIVYIKESHIQECFGGTGVWDLYGRSVLDLGKYIRDIAIYYFIYLAELDLSGFNFAEDNRMLNLTNFWIGLH